MSIINGERGYKTGIDVVHDPWNVIKIEKRDFHKRIQ